MVNEQSSSIENNVFSLLKSSHNMQRANKELIQSNNVCDLNEQSARSPVNVTGPVSSLSRDDHALITSQARATYTAVCYSSSPAPASLTAQQRPAALSSTARAPVSAAARAQIAEV